MDERIERIRKHVQGGCYDHYPEYGRVPAINDLNSIESDLASLREQHAEAKHQRDVARRALDIIMGLKEHMQFHGKCMKICSEFKEDKCNCKRAALAMAEADIKAE